MENEKELLEKVKSEVNAKLVEAKEGFASKEDYKQMQEVIKSFTNKEDLEEIKSEIEKIALDVKKSTEQKAVEKESLRQLIEKNSTVLKTIRENKDSINSGFKIEVTKATQSYGDIGSRDYLGTIESGIEKKAVRKTSILDIFAVDTVSTEILHYWEEDTITRDAKFVVACATSTHTTKKNFIKRTVELAKIRDIVDVCVDMLEDYSFMESEIRALVFESIQLKKENELLLGTGVLSSDMLSINTVSSEFLPNNPLAPFDGANGFQDANLEQLIDAMSAQIYIFGQQNKWMTDTVVMNYADFVRFRNLKDADGNKIVNIYGSDISIAGHRVITSPLVASNTLYVFDSTKGRIKQRKGYTATLSYENKDNIEHETATLVAYERCQFYVKNINRDAFMKCSDVTQAIIDITKP